MSVENNFAGKNVASRSSRHGTLLCSAAEHLEQLINQLFVIAGRAEMLDDVLKLPFAFAYFVPFNARRVVTERVKSRCQKFHLELLLVAVCQCQRPYLRFLTVNRDIIIIRSLVTK